MFQKNNLFKYTLGLVVVMMFFQACTQTNSPNTDLPANPVETPSLQENSETVAAKTLMPTNSPVENTDPDHPENDFLTRIPGFAVQLPCMKSGPCQVDGVSYSDGYVLKIFGMEAEEIEAVRLESSGNVVHIFGSVDEFGYYLQRFDTQQVLDIMDGQTRAAYQLPGIHSILGIPGLDRIAVSMLPGTYQDFPASQIQLVPGMGYAAIANSVDEVILPINIMQTNDFNLELWYTREPYGIGGDIVYPYQQGLYWTNGQETKTLLDEGYRLAGLSGDGELIAFTETAEGPLSIKKLGDDRATTYLLLAESNRGAGYASFSPQNDHVVWIETSGSLRDDSLQTVLRWSGPELRKPQAWRADEFAALIGRDVRFMRPVGWLNDSTVLVQIDPTTKSELPVVLLLDLFAGTQPQVITGSFVGLLQ